MSVPHLFTSPKELSAIQDRLNQYDWYRAAFCNMQSACDEMLKRGFFVPETSGFVFYITCKRDNTNLIFDPYHPDDHICPTCGMNYKDEPFRRAWQCSYHHWLSQMSVRLGICYAMTGKEAYAEAVRKMLLDYVRLYPGYPNKDNELGTTRVFQSTYMESVWLTYLCCGYDLVNSASCFTQSDRNLICRELFAASAAVIYDYDEKRNNRQAFNNAGMCAAAIMTEDNALFDYTLNGPHGFVYHMNESVLSDGLWYEGDNYHFATVPSIVNIAEMCVHNGMDLYHREFNGHTIQMMFDAPLLSLQPDLTFPSRKDSPYASLIAQTWYAGLYELAYRRYGSESYGKILKAAYAYRPAAGQQFKNAAGVMDVSEPESASRARLDWRGFLNAQPDLGAAEGVPFITSVNMEGTGLAVLRRDKGTSYVSVDYGNYGGGHGHPDRLALTFFANGHRWLTDYGTGQYYFDHLNWYRSTIGHNTLGIDGKQQLKSEGSCTVFGEGKLASAAKCTIDGLAPGVTASRTTVLFDHGLLLDVLEAEGDAEHTYTSYLHGFGTLEVPNQTLSPDVLENDCSRFLGPTFSCTPSGSFCAQFSEQGNRLLLRFPSKSAERVYVTSAYGPPTAIPEQFPILALQNRSRGVKFVSLLEEISDGETSAVSDFQSTSTGAQIALTNGNHYEIILDNGITVRLLKNGELIGQDAFRETKKYDSIPETPVFAQEWIDFQAKDGLPLKVSFRNCLSRSVSVTTSFADKEIHLAPKEVKLFRFPMHCACTVTTPQSWEFSYLLRCENYEEKRSLKKAYVHPERVPRRFPLDQGEFIPNITLERADQMMRTERHWNGPQDLSAQAMVFISGNESLTLRIRVTDNCVLFSGGKFPFDNDGVMIFFDRRTEEYRNVADSTEGVYGILAKAGVFDEVSEVTAVTRSVRQLEKIGISVIQTQTGYEMLLDIPFECIGGIPKPDDVMGFDLVVNDRDSGVRRELQAVWSGAQADERIYLREANHSPLRFGLLEL